MTRDHYQTAVKKMQRIMLITSLVVAGPVLYGLMRLMDTFDAPLRSYGEAVRSRFGEVAGGAIGGLSFAPIAIIPLLLWLGAMLAFDRRIGIRCPHCQRSLTARCLPRRVLASGECSLCNKRIFDESGLG